MSRPEIPRVTMLARGKVEGEYEIVQPKAGGVIRIPAAEVDFAASYTFQAWEDQKFFQWTGVRAERVGDHAVFTLPAKEAQ